MIVKPNIASNDAEELSLCFKGFLVYHVGLHRVEERFHMGIISNPARAVRALNKAERLQTTSISRAGVLDAAIRVKDHSTAWSTVVHRAIERR